jgi:hypothetical protein
MTESWSRATSVTPFCVNTAAWTEDLDSIGNPIDKKLLATIN